MPEVWLREWRAADRAAVASVLDDPRVVRWSRMAQQGADVWIAEQRLGQRGPSLAICEAGGDRALGKVALRLPGRASPATTCAAMNDEDQPAGEIGYWIVPEARGRGIATAGVRAMLDHIRDVMDPAGPDAMRSIVLDIEIDNAASLRLAQRIGARRREPTRVEADRTGALRTLAVHVLRL